MAVTVPPPHEGSRLHGQACRIGPSRQGGSEPGDDEWLGSRSEQLSHQDPSALGYEPPIVGGDQTEHRKEAAQWIHVFFSCREAGNSSMARRDRRRCWPAELSQNSRRNRSQSGQKSSSGPWVGSPTTSMAIRASCRSEPLPTCSGRLAPTAVIMFSTDTVALYSTSRRSIGTKGWSAADVNRRSSTAAAGP